LWSLTRQAQSLWVLVSFQVRGSRVDLIPLHGSRIGLSPLIPKEFLRGQVFERNRHAVRGRRLGAQAEFLQKELMFREHRTIEARSILYLLGEGHLHQSRRHEGSACFLQKRGLEFGSVPILRVKVRGAE